ncbi:major capsid protein [Leucobacter sp. cx-42]|uniref:major capsid protein n=1 Tax=unclassified Leucobacter TaxID=2621730 RepID=UPI00165E4804|nr:MULTISPECIES: major capsid protein [unclassified Leucobacter]MBC9954940.1 major capsid protein [Leucobacter sp. cx-42]
MAIVFDAEVGAGALTAFTRNVPAEDNLRLFNEVPSRTNATNEIDFAKIVKRNRTASYRAFDGSISVSARDSGSTRTVGMIPLSDSRNVGEYERLKLEFARTKGTNTALLADALYNDAEDLTRNIQRRLELALGDVLSDGILTVNENGLVGFEADFGVPADHKVSPAGAKWSDIVTAKVLTDLLLWHAVYVVANGAPAGAIRTSQRVLTLVQTNKEIIDAVHGSASGKTRVSRAALNELLATEGLPPFVDPYDYQVDHEGKVVRTIADDKLQFTPASLGDFMHVEWGVTATALELVNSTEVDFSFGDAAGIVGVVEKVGPPYRQFTFVDAVAMPVIDRAEALFIATVL